jgi:hypothetical protein
MFGTMNKVAIRLIGYIVYSVIWLPVTIPMTVLNALEEFITYLVQGKSVKECCKDVLKGIRDSIKYDINFVRNG